MIIDKLYFKNKKIGFIDNKENIWYVYKAVDSTRVKSSLSKVYINASLYKKGLVTNCLSLKKKKEG